MSHDISSLLNKVSAMVGYWDKDLRNQFGNQAYAAWFGITPEQMLGKHLRDVIGEERYQLNLPYIEGALRGEAQQFERSIPLPDGKLVRHSLAEYIPDIVDGEVQGIIVHVSDISLVKNSFIELEGYSRYLKAIIDNLFAYVALLDTNGVVLEVNKAPLERAGFRREEVIGQLFYDAPWWSYRQEVRDRIIRSIECAKRGETDRFEIDAKMGDHFQSLDFMISPVHDELGKVVGLIPSAVDISFRKQIEADLKIAATAFQSKVGILVTDANNKILRANQAYLDTVGYAEAEVVDQNPSLFKSGKHSEEFYAAMWKTIHETGSWEGEIWDRRKDGRLFAKWISITAIKNEAGILTNFVSTQADITARKLAEEEVKRMALHDALTDLPNRRLLMDRLQQAITSFSRTGKEGALLFIDLDNFKTLNDTLGHHVGDLLLIQVAQRLKASVREGDTVARLGGDEFVVMLEDLSQNDVEAAAQAKMAGVKILAALNQPYQLAEHEYRSTPSIGVTLLNDQHHSIDEMLKEADIAMYQAKQSGRNALRFFDPKMQEAIHSRVSLEKELLKAIEKGEFQLHYQTQVNGARHTQGAEALIRWRHPTRGLLAPVHFIPLAEESGLILPIGLWVIEAACAQLKLWQDNDRTRTLTLAVNISAKQVHQEDFVSQVKAIVERHSINPNLFKLELTESMLVENVEATIAKIHELKTFGVQFSLDDFGTGYSSLQYLKKMPMDQLKIDQSFVRDLEVDHHDRTIVRTIIAIAQSLELNVIAEGVETEQQLHILSRKGCEHYQGYFFGKPMPIEEFEQKL
jgi:diguanylate cyclase (GGDEF)-like protein/PAS domain S-box-containing protein